MNTDNNDQGAVTDDAELAKVLDGINGTAPAADNSQTTSGLQFEETPAPAADPSTPAEDVTPVVDAPAVEEPAVETPAPEEPVATPTYTGDDQYVTPSTDETPGELDDIKKNALEELRPLVGKLNLPADEKFDTLLLIIRSTDDQSLVTTAYDVAKTIEDETRRAQALIDVIKEIDYFDNKEKS